jgi:hypothetical protein
MPTAIFVPPMSMAPITIFPFNRYFFHQFPRSIDSGLCRAQSGPASSREKLDRALMLDRLAKSIAQEISHWLERCLLIGATSPPA